MQGPGNKRTGFIAVLLAGLLVPLAGLTHSGHHHAETDAPALKLAVGHGALPYPLPPPDSYRLPVIRPAVDGLTLDDTGEPISLRDLFDDRIVLLSFIFTTCTDVNGCSLASGVMGSVRNLLSDAPELAERIRLISLSFDPANDSPEVMRRYGALFRADRDWRFLTTTGPAQLQPLLDAYGQHIEREYDSEGNELGSFAHLLKVFLIDREQRIRNIYSVDFLHPRLLVNDIHNLVLEERGLLVPADIVDTDLVIGPGDPRHGYESAEFRTRSRSLARRGGQPTDLLALADTPQTGLPALPVPADNPLTHERIALGRKLFYDRRLSLNHTMSCAMCHIPEQGFTNNELATPIGFEGRTVRRNAPTLLNVGHKRRLLHDGRETALEQQAWQPLLAPNEMANPSIAAVVETLRRLPDYRGLFEDAFDGRSPGMETIGMALAAYQRTLVAGASAFDRWYYADEEDALNPEARHGFELFIGKAGCAGCHTIGEEYALFTDQQWYNTGIGWYRSMRPRTESRRVQVAPGVFLDVPGATIASVAEAKPGDLGLYELTQDPADRWRYLTPSLRNIALTAPYMHDGSLGTLEQVIEYYNRGGHAHELLDPRLRPLDLDETEKAALVAFLESLTGSTVETLVRDAFAAPIGDAGAERLRWVDALVGGE